MAMTAISCHHDELSPAQYPDTVLRLTADIPSFDITGEPEDRFNVRQFEVIVNAFLSARHGQDKWVLGYNDNSLYLDHDVIFNRKQSLEEIRTEVATFVLQFRGVTHAVSATAMQNGCCGNPVTRRMQNGFYPRRSGDVVICLAPDRIEEREDKVSMSGSPYRVRTITSSSPTTRVPVRSPMERPREASTTWTS